MRQAVLKLAAVIFVTLSIPSCFTDSNSVIENEDNLIKVDTLNDRVISVSLGYDAVTAINSGNGIIVIDAGISNSLTAKYRAKIENIFKKNNFKYLINTHSHWDHTGGNQVFNDAVIVGHKNCIAEIQDDTRDPEVKKTNLLKLIREYENQLDTTDDNQTELREIHCQKIRYQLTYNDWTTDRIITYPELTFTDTMNINMGDVNLNLIYFGEAHSGSDILIYVPEEKILFTGDLFFKYGRPSIGAVGKNDVERWKFVEQWLIKRIDNIEVVLSGHGIVMGKKDLEDFNEYIDDKWAEFN